MHAVAKCLRSKPDALEFLLRPVQIRKHGMWTALEALQMIVKLDGREVTSLNERFFIRSSGNEELDEHGIGEPSIVPCQWGVLSCCNAP